MRIPKWLARILIFLRCFNIQRGLVCQGCGHEIVIDGMDQAAVIAATEAHDRFFHPERIP